MIVQVSLDLAGTNDSDILLIAKDYTTQILGSSNFKAPAVSTSMASVIVEQCGLVNTAVTGLSTSLAAPISSSKTEVVKSARFILDTNLTALSKTIESVANGATVLDINRVGILNSAGMKERTPATRQKQVFTAVPGDVEGSVFLTAKGVPRAAHEWKYTDDIVSFTNQRSIDPTLKASVTITSLAKAKQFAFYHRTIEKDGPTAWEGPILANAR